VTIGTEFLCSQRAKGPEEFASDTCFEAKLKIKYSSSSVKSNCFFCYFSGFQLYILRNCLTARVKEID